VQSTCWLEHGYCLCCFLSGQDPCVRTVHGHLQAACKPWRRRRRDMRNPLERLQVCRGHFSGYKYLVTKENKKKEEKRKLKQQGNKKEKTPKNLLTSRFLPANQKYQACKGGRHRTTPSQEPRVKTSKVVSLGVGKCTNGSERGASRVFWLQD
jgi:hypothetical protein